MDFLNYAKEDIHWWSTWFNQFVLCLAVLAFSQTANAEIDITTSVIEVFSKHAFGLYLIRQLYFNSKFQFKFKTKCVLVITLLINIALILRYHILEKKGANWWSTIVLRDIVLYFIIFIQMGFEYKSWDNKILKWRESLVLDQRFANNDESETFIRKNIDSMIEQIVEVDGKLDLSKIDEQMPIDKEMSMSVKAKKVMALDGDIFSATYVSLIKKNKNQYRLTQADQFDLLYKTMLIMAIQIFFILGVFVINKTNFVLYNNTAL